MAARHPSQRWFAAVLALAVLTAAGCSSSDSASGSSTPATTAGSASPDPRAAAVARIEASLPPAPDPADAATVPEDCMATLAMQQEMGHGPMPGQTGDGHAHHGGGEVEETTPIDSGTAADGRFFRTFAGSNPRTEVSDVAFESVPTDDERTAAAEFVDEVRQVVDKNGWTDPVVLARDGFRPMQLCNSHWVNVDAILDGKDLDAEHPEFVVVMAGEDGVQRFESVMFQVSEPMAPGPQPFGPIAIWHYHDGAVCAIGGSFTLPKNAETCPAGTTEHPRSPEMLHVRLDDDPYRPDM